MSLEVARYCNRWKELLRLEHRAQTKILDHRLRNMRADQLQHQGYCLTNIKLQIKGTFYGDRIARLSLSDHSIFPMNHQFNEGNQIMLSRDHPLSSKYTVLKGSVLDRHKRFIDVVLYQNTFQQTKTVNIADSRFMNGVWRMDVGVDEQTIHRMQSAIETFGDSTFNGSKTLQKIISSNFNDPSTLMIIDRDEVMKYDVNKSKTRRNTTLDTTKISSHSTGSRLKYREISNFKQFLVDQLLGALNNLLPDQRNEDSSIYKDLKSEIESLCTASEFDLNLSQLNAVQASLQNIVSLIQGPNIGHNMLCPYVLIVDDKRILYFVHITGSRVHPNGCAIFGL